MLPLLPSWHSTVWHCLQTCAEHAVVLLQAPRDYTAEILCLVLDENDASQLLFEVASLLARAHVPESFGGW